MLHSCSNRAVDSDVMPSEAMKEAPRIHAVHEAHEAPTLLTFSRSTPATPLKQAKPNPLVALRKAKMRAALFDEPVKEKRFGRFLVRGVLGRGGMGTVLEAYDDALERPVALKQLNADLDRQHTQRLVREAKALAKLSHPNVVQVYEVGQVDGQMFIAMELVRGQTLQVWQQQRHEWRECVQVYLQAGRGLLAAHAQGLVHRDFKPGNCIIDEQGRVRVLDFGLVRQVDRAVMRSVEHSLVTQQCPRFPRSPQVNSQRDPLMTQPGAVLGTLAYMPLEQLSGGAVDARSDQFSFCVALYEALYGQRPYASHSVGELTLALIESNIAPAPKGSRVPTRLRRVLLRGLSSAPEKRWPSMEVLLQELSRLVEPRRRAWAGLLGAMVVGVVGTSAAVWSQADTQCQGARGHLEGVWDAGRKQQVQAAIEGTGLAYANETWTRVEQGLDKYSEQWVSKYTDVCEATWVDQVQSAKELDLRMACLDERKAELRATVQTLGQADGKVVEHEQAEQILRRALDILEQAFGQTHPQVAYPLVGLAEVALAQHQFETARGDAERAIAIRTSNKVPPEELAEARFVLAKSLWPTPSERPRARSVAEQAREGFAEAGEGEVHRRDEVDQWLNNHRIP